MDLVKSPIAYFYLFFWRQVYDVIYPPKSSNSKNKKHTICKNDMFYIHGKFGRNRTKISEVEAYWCFCMHFWQACVAAFDLLRIPCGAPHAAS